MRLVPQKLEQGFLASIEPVGRLLIRWDAHPNAISAAGLVMSVIAGLFYWKGLFVLAAVMVILNGVCDIMDGRLARTTGKTSKYGALFDSTLDRYSEVAMFMGLVAYFRNGAEFVDVLIVLTLAGSIMTSYLRARAGALGIDCKVGVMQRPERMAYLAVGSILGQIHPTFLVVTLAVIAVLSNVTVIQRVVYTKRALLAVGTNPGKAPDDE